MKTELTLATPYPTYKLHLLGICLTLITACSVFKEKSFYETDSLQRQESRKEVKTEASATRQALQIYSSSDSADQQSLVEIYPSGIFKYSQKDGFSGEASRLVINERLRSRKLETGETRVSQKQQSKIAVKEGGKLLKQTQKKEKHKTPKNMVWLYLAGCVWIFILIWRFRGILQTAR